VLQNDLIAERYAAPPPEPIVGASAIAQIARKIG
jgi:hypothetical protein